MNGLFTSHNSPSVFLRQLLVQKSRYRTKVLYLENMHAIVHAADSYGWLLHMIAIYAASSIGPIALYGGNFDSVVVATITSVFTTLEMFVIQHYFPNMCSWIVPICSFTTGLLSPILWQGLTDYFDSAQW